jgi:hypothetical protein
MKGAAIYGTSFSILQTNDIVICLSRIAACCSALAPLARLQAEMCFFRRTCRRKKRLNFIHACGRESLKSRPKTKAANDTFAASD